ncbi:hypothetical protein Pen02_81700 [Plantactinospora endophytica]|uniref:Uncharacterized protein n=1 Tax=Plantactinospora endophytica TaxID=673535 RepID=A0ABQ4EET8_9ACTN|nr:hypothetical protein Pen02_81700 [Plantactinospora endophytica]
MGFTKPVVNSTRYLQNLGLLPEGLDAALEASYQRPGKAEGFKVPESVIEALRELPPGNSPDLTG